MKMATYKIFNHLTPVKKLETYKVTTDRVQRFERLQNENEDTFMIELAWDILAPNLCIIFRILIK